MKVFIVYCHPSEDSFTSCIRDAFINGLKDAGHEYTVSDLYRMDFKTDMTEKEYLRDAYYRNTPDLADDVLAEQAKINASDAIVFFTRCSGRKRLPNWSGGLTGCGPMALPMEKRP